MSMRPNEQGCKRYLATPIELREVSGATNASLFYHAALNSAPFSEVWTRRALVMSGRKLVYLLTPKGIDLAPVLTEMVLWAAAHEDTENQALVQQMRANKQEFLAGVRQRWANRMRP